MSNLYLVKAKVAMVVCCLQSHLCVRFMRTVEEERTNLAPPLRSFS